ncbi:MAG TPA: hypothetical protein VGP46_11190 [Acidimicrobiales bacterium]|jgi:hypothetical protein|nr:hypothetical protein [Acidimicrobiales bacterium]
MRQRLSALLRFACGSLIIVGVAVSASATAGASSWRQATEVDGRVLLTGQVPGDQVADLVVYEWPSDQVLRQLARPGTAVPTKQIYDGRSSLKGGFSVLTTAVPAGAELQVLAFDADGVQTALVDPFAGSQRLRLTAIPGQGRRLSMPSAAITAGRPRVVSCGQPQYDLGYSPQWDVIGQTYIDNAGGTTATVDYTAGSDSTIGVGISSSGSAGTFSGDGTDSVSSDAKENFPIEGNNTYYYYLTEFSSALYRTTCYNSLNGDYTYTYQTRNIGWDGGTRLQNAGGAPSVHDCSPYIPGSGLNLNRTAAVTWSDGYDLGNVLGLNLSTQTGYSSSTSLDYQFSQSHHLCGTENYPARTDPGPGQLVATK